MSRVDGHNLNLCNTSMVDPKMVSREKYSDTILKKSPFVTLKKIPQQWGFATRFGNNLRNLEIFFVMHKIR